MGCGSCGSKNGLPAGCRNNGACGTGGCNKLNVFDWLANMQLPAGQEQFDIVEVRFKNSRKEFFRKENGVTLYAGDVVAVEASPGHDIGVVSLTGELVRLQMKKKNVSYDSQEIKKIYRKARQTDIDKWTAARELETETMYRARKIAVSLKLNMKISDVEYQGDKTKAIFYYTAEERVDFRELIKVLAEEFKVRIEMRQIGLRQEAGRLGGIGSCGRELCCSTWLTDFRTVSTSAARYQQLSLNPLKLAGQCGKLKCCLNYELDAYMEAIKEFPETNVKLNTKKGLAFHQKTDIFRRKMWYSYEGDPSNFIELTVERVKEIGEMNKAGQLPEELSTAEVTPRKKEPDYENVVGQDDVTRFDQARKKRSKPKKRKTPGQQGSTAEKSGEPRQQQARPQQERRPEGQRPQGQRTDQPRRQQQQKPGQPGRRPEQGEQRQGGERPAQQGADKPQQQQQQRRNQGPRPPRPNRRPDNRKGTPGDQKPNA